MESVLENLGLTAEYSSPEVALHTTHWPDRGRHMERPRTDLVTASVPGTAFVFNVLNMSCMYHVHYLSPCLGCLFPEDRGICLVHRCASSVPRAVFGKGATQPEVE